MTIAPEARGYVTQLVMRDAQAVGKGAGSYGWLEGRAVPYDTFADIGWFMEAHAAGSFAKSTKAGTGKGLPLLLFHDNRNFPIGKADSWNHEDGGMDGVWRLNDSAQAQTAARAANDGELVGMSVGFQPIRSSWDYVDDWNPDLGPEHMDKVTREESRLLEVSLTPTPAFADAGVTLVRTAFNVQQRQALRTKPPQVEAWRDIVEGLRSAQL
jgi:HK97 family phage prohead protease